MNNKLYKRKAKTVHSRTVFYQRERIIGWKFSLVQTAFEHSHASCILEIVIIQSKADTVHARIVLIRAC